MGADSGDGGKGESVRISARLPPAARRSVVPVIDMSLTGMIPLTLRHDSSHLFNQRALQERGKMGYSGPRPPSVPGVLATTLHHDPVTWSSMIVEFSEWVTCNYHVWYSRRVRIAQNQSSRHVKSP